MEAKVTLDTEGRVLILKSLREHLRLGSGNTLQLNAAGDGITLRTIRPKHFRAIAPELAARIRTP